VSDDVANELRRRCDLEERDLPENIRDFVERHETNSRQLTLRLVEPTQRRRKSPSARPRWAKERLHHAARYRPGTPRTFKPEIRSVKLLRRHEP
jgi:hypothetical protein